MGLRARGGGGGGTLIYSAYVGSDPASTTHPQKISGISSTPPKKKKNIPILYLDLKKDPKLHKNDTQASPILWWPKKISLKSSYPQKIFIFLKTPKNIEIQNFEPKKIAQAYVCVKISRVPPWGCVKGISPLWWGVPGATLALRHCTIHWYSNV